MRRGFTAGRALQYVALAGYVVFLGFPLLWLLSTSFKTPRELASVSPSLFPESYGLDNFTSAIEQQGLISAGLNSLIVACCSTALVIAIAVPAAYAITRFRTWLQGPATLWILVTQVFPGILIIIPLFLILKQFGFVDTLQGLILVTVVWTLPFALWMLCRYVGNIPGEIEEAAAVDGAGRLRTLVHVVLPLLVPGIAATAMFAFVATWNEFFFALVLIQNPALETLPLALARFVGQEGQVQLGPLAAGSLLSMLPSLVFFAFMQRRLASGLMAGAIKG